MLLLLPSKPEDPLNELQLSWLFSLICFFLFGRPILKSVEKITVKFIIVILSQFLKKIPSQCYHHDIQITVWPRCLKLLSFIQIHVLINNRRTLWIYLHPFITPYNPIINICWSFTLRLLFLQVPSYTSKGQHSIWRPVVVWGNTSTWKRALIPT